MGVGLLTDGNQGLSRTKPSLLRPDPWLQSYPSNWTVGQTRPPRLGMP